VSSSGRSGRAPPADEGPPLAEAAPRGRAAELQMWSSVPGGSGRSSNARTIRRRRMASSSCTEGDQPSLASCSAIAIRRR